MKKIYLLLTMLLMLVGASPTWGQKALPYEYGFEDSPLGDGWTTVSCHSSSIPQATTKRTGSYAFAFHWNAPGQYLISPELTPDLKGIQVTFYYSTTSSYDESFKVGYSTSDTEISSFTFGDEITIRSTSWLLYENTFPEDTKYIAIQCTSNDKYYLYIDDFKADVPPACPKPTGLTAANSTYQGATLSWTAGSDETEWKVIYGAAGFDPASEGTTIDNITTNPYTLTGLTPETEYDVYVKAVKGSDVSPVSNKANFTTTERYPAPTGLTASGITTTSATIGWTANGDETKWEITWNTTGTTPEEEGSYTEVSTTSYEITGLTAETTYYAFVRSKDGDNHSAWSAKCEFTPSANTYLTVNDGTTTNQYVPIYGYFTAAADLGGQFIIPAANLTDLQNKVIKKLTFYSSVSDYAYGDAEFDVMIKEVNSATMTTSMYAWDESWATVYSGTLAVVGGKMNITFTSDYNYNGSNLLVGIHKTSTDKAGSNWNVTFYGTNAGSGNYRSHYNPNGNRQTFQPKTTIGYQEKTGSELKVFDGETELTESPASFDFGLAAEGDTHTFTLKNTAATPYEAAITSTNLTVAPAAVTPTAEGVNFTVAMPANDITDEPVVITPAAGSGLDPFTINVSGTLRDPAKVYEAITTALPTGWSVDGSWSYNANGAYTTAWYINPAQGNIARMKTPLLTVAAGEKFIVEAKGYETNNTSYQHMKLQYSTDGTTWTDLGEELALDPNNWKTFTVTAPNDFVAGNYYIGILASRANIRLFYGGEIVSGPKFAINTDGTSQSFGNVEQNASATKEFTITNNGNQALTVDVTNAADFYVQKTLNFTNNKGWSDVYLYAWIGEGDDKIEPLGAWPGEKQTNITGQNEYSQDVYAINVPVGAKFIMNNNNGAQSQDITLDFTQAGIYLDGDNSPYTTQYWGDADASIFNSAGQIVVAADGGTTTFTARMVTSKTVGEKSGDIVLGYDDILGDDQTFTIPCTGYVIDHSKLYVTFTDAEWPAEILQHGNNWIIYSATAAQSSTSEMSSLILKPVTVVDGKDLKFKVARYSSSNSSARDMYLRYTTDGGVTWTEYNWGTSTSLKDNITSTLTEQTVTGIPAGTAVFDFYGKYIKIDDIIADYTVTSAPLVEFTEVSDNISGANLQADATASYTLKNIGNADYVATVDATNVTVGVTGEEVTYEAGTLTVPAGKTATITATMAFAAPYGAKNGSLAITSESWVGDINKAYTATLVDPTAFLEDFSGNARPAGWYSEAAGAIYSGWVFTNGDARINTGIAKPMITEKIGAEEGKNVLSFNAQVASGESSTLNVYTSSNRKDWSAAQTFNLTAASQNFNLTALTDGNYYVKFEANNAIVDNISGVKKVDLPAHDLFEISNTIAATGAPENEFTATVTGISLIADEADIVAELWIKKSDNSKSQKVASLEGQSMTANTSKTFTLTGNLPNWDEGNDYKMYITVKKSDDAAYFNTDEVDFTLAHNVSMAINSFTVTTHEVQADDNNEYTATYNIKVTNSGTRDLNANEVSVSLVNKTSEPDVENTATWTAANSQTVFLNPGEYTNDGAVLALYSWGKAETWTLFTETSKSGLYSAELNGNTNFSIVRLKKEGDDGYSSENGGLNWDNKYNQSVDYTVADGNEFTFSSWDGEKQSFGKSTMANLPKGVSTTLQVTVNGTLTDGENKNLTFYAREDVTNTLFTEYSTYASRTAAITAAPVIVLDEAAGTISSTGQNRKVQLTRSFVEGWNTICLPFETPVTTFGTEATAYAFKAYTTGLQFASAATLEAGKPYLIHVPAANDGSTPFELSGVTVSNTLTPAEFSGASFIGTFEPMAAGSLTGKYGVTKTGKIQKAGESAFMKGFRAYFELPNDAKVSIIITDADGNTTNLDDYATGINRLFNDGTLNPDEPIYNTQGQQVSKSYRGVVIQNGKKFVIK